jgi:hypothetical protein
MALSAPSVPSPWTVTTTDPAPALSRQTVVVDIAIKAATVAGAGAATAASLAQRNLAHSLPLLASVPSRMRLGAKTTRATSLLRRRPLSKSIGAGRARAGAGDGPVLPEDAPAPSPSSRRRDGEDLAAPASTWTPSTATIAQPRSALPAPPWLVWFSTADAVSRGRTTSTTVTAPPVASEKAFPLQLPELRVQPLLACMRSARPRKNPKHWRGHPHDPGRFSIVSRGATAVRQGLQGATRLW